MRKIKNTDGEKYRHVIRADIIKCDVNACLRVVMKNFRRMIIVYIAEEIYSEEWDL